MLWVVAIDAGGPAQGEVQATVQKHQRGCRRVAWLEMKVEATDLATEVSRTWARIGCDGQEKEKKTGSDCPPQSPSPVFGP